MDFTNANCLVDGYFQARKASGWKWCTQKYGLNLLKNTYEIQKSLRNDTYKADEQTVFRICEQGHLRVVKAPTIKDTVVHHAVANNVMLPAFVPHMIHDSGASLKGKGISFTRRRFEQHLSWYYRHYGIKGYVLKLDFRKYFDNLRHDVLRDIMGNYISDKHVIHVINEFLRINRVDVSYSSDANIIDDVFSAIEYAKINPELLTGERHMDKSLGIGSVISQAFGIFTPSRIDTYCKTVKGIHCYDAYMDDRIIIHPSKEYLTKLLHEIECIAAQYGLHVHKNKTQIIKLSHGFTFLKTKYILTSSGKIIRRVPRDVVVRQRRRMKKLARFVVDGTMSIHSFKNQYRAWRGDLKRKYQCYYTINNMDELYKELIQWIMKKNKWKNKRNGSQSLT